MRFEIVLFISSLLVLAFAGNQSPDASPGDTVRFQDGGRTHRALVVGSPDKNGKLDLAPFGTGYHKNLVANDHIMKAHPDDIVRIPNQPSKWKLASVITSGHVENRPSVSHVRESAFGSKKYRDAAPPMPSSAAGLRNGKYFRSA